MTDKTPEREALEHIIAVLEPLYWKCPDHSCEGCEYEHDDALVTAMNVIAGVPGDDWVGPMLPTHREDGKLILDRTPEYEDAWRAWRERLHGYWRAAGFQEDILDGRTIWRRGTAV